MGTRRLSAAAITLLLVAAMLGLAPAATAAKNPFTIPVKLGNATQVITVTAASRTATTGTLRAYEKKSNGTWRKVFGPIKAHLGKQGVGKASEWASRTPQGTFTLTEAFGAKKNPGTKLPYHRTTTQDWWVSDTTAPSYNTLMRCKPAACPFNTRVSERLRSITPYYDYAVVMDVNRNPVKPGGGSAFFLHVTPSFDKGPTAGCVSISVGNLKKIMKWLKPKAHPRIAIGVK